MGNDSCKGSEKCETYLASCLSVTGIGRSPGCPVPQFREKFGAVAKRPCQQQTRTCQHFQAFQQEDLVYNQCQTFLLSLVTIWLLWRGKLLFSQAVLQYSSNLAKADHSSNMNSRFGTSELRLNLLDASLPFEWVHFRISLALIVPHPDNKRSSNRSSPWQLELPNRCPRYPVNVYSDVFDPRTAQSYEELARYFLLDDLSMYWVLYFNTQVLEKQHKVNNMESVFSSW